MHRHRYGSSAMSSTRRHWTALSLLLLAGFATLLWMGGEIHRTAPPMPEREVSAAGATLFTREDIEEGRIAWQSIGGQQLGAIWGHGAYVAPDWSADCLHREATALLDVWSRSDHAGAAFDKLDPADKDALTSRLRREIRKNTYDASSHTITVSNDTAAAINDVAAHYVSLFGDAPATQALRETYAMRNNAVDTAAH